MDGALVAVPEVDDPTGELKTAVAKFSHNIKNFTNHFRI